MNRIYQGRVGNVEIPVRSAAAPFSAPDGETFVAGAAAKGVREVGSQQGRASGGEQVHVAQPDEVPKPRKKGEVSNQPEWQPLPNWQEALWQHHQLFQDTVNF